MDIILVFPLTVMHVLYVSWLGTLQIFNPWERVSPYRQGWESEEKECRGWPEYKVALTACMRKLSTILNAMVKNYTPWQFRVE
jgi:hypothetical protein